MTFSSVVTQEKRASAFYVSVNFLFLIVFPTATTASMTTHLVIVLERETTEEQKKLTTTMMRPSERVRVGGRVALPIILHTPNATQLNCTEMINKKRIKIRSKLSPTREFALFSSSSTFARGNQTDVTTRTQRKNKRIKSEAATCCFDFSEEKKKKVSWGISWIETKEKKLHCRRHCTLSSRLSLPQNSTLLRAIFWPAGQAERVERAHASARVER